MQRTREPLAASLEILRCAETSEMLGIAACGGGVRMTREPAKPDTLGTPRPNPSCRNYGKARGDQIMSSASFWKLQKGSVKTLAPSSAMDSASLRVMEDHSRCD
jgi:hypothetical protein